MIPGTKMRSPMQWGAHYLCRLEDAGELLDLGDDLIHGIAAVLAMPKALALLLFRGFRDDLPLGVAVTQRIDLNGFQRQTAGCAPLLSQTCLQTGSLAGRLPIQGTVTMSRYSPVVSGLSHTVLGTCSIPLDILIQLARLYNTSIDYLLGETNNPRRYE